MKIVFTGGGTAGHVMVNKVLIPFFKEKDSDCKIVYIGSKKGMEKDIISDISDVKFYSIHTGKLRRYFSWENVKDVFRLLKGTLEAYKILKKERPQLIYSGGGYVVVPVVWAARFLKIPIILRETDYTIGLANKLCMPFAKKLYLTFPDTQKQIEKIPCFFPGMIIRPQLFCEFEKQDLEMDSTKKTCLVMGGSLGAKKINEFIWNNIKKITENYNVIHICGRGKLNSNIKNTQSYRQVQFINDISKCISTADVVVTRCGSNAISEGLSLGKRMICIPITTKTTRGEQGLNASFATKNGNAIYLSERDLDLERFLKSISKVLELNNPTPFCSNKEEMISRIKNHVDNIFSTASKQFIKDMIKYAKDDSRINIQDLSTHEVLMLSEVVENYKLK